MREGASMLVEQVAGRVLVQLVRVKGHEVDDDGVNKESVDRRR